MTTIMKVLGWLIAIPGAICTIMAPFPALQEDNTSATMGLIIMALMFDLPAGLLLRGAYSREREAALQEQMAGFVRSHDSFSIDELAAHLGKTPGETQMLLTRDIAVFQLPLVLHRASGRYMRMDRLDRAAQVAERCQSCGGSLGQQIVFEGERLSCPYCGVAVITQAANSAGWQTAQGPWGHHNAAAGPYQAAPQYVQPQHQQQPPTQTGGPWARP